MYHLPVSTHICIITYRISTNPSVSSSFFKNIQDSLAKSLSFTFWLLYNLQILKRLLANLTSIRYFNNIWNILYFLLYSETMKEDSCAIQGSFTKDYQAFYLSSSSPFFFFFCIMIVKKTLFFPSAKLQLSYCMWTVPMCYCLPLTAPSNIINSMV